ncbi:hypothetical protein DM860_005200 [Cuscuta australis]|uniref:F-box domain-containing protein n=1 Tax=Cuscuta australis TaxID=267555 RepID=A0A328DRR8_9ASTE|nr:hypothetical protein DM860_005200 [Cuscuta australis]
MFLFIVYIMKGEETSWVGHCYDHISRDSNHSIGFNSSSSSSSSVHNDESDSAVVPVLIDVILPNDLLERILACLPIASLFRAGCVCKRWHGIVNSKQFLWNFSQVLPKKPWYFMFTSPYEPIGYVYDSFLRKWYRFELPCIETSSCFIASSCGLVCFMDNDSRSQLCICNPITKRSKKLEEFADLRFSDYSALAISVERKAQRCDVTYSVVVLKSKQVPGNFFQWDLSIHTYDSETMTWATPFTERLEGWRGGDESVICDGMLYFLIYSTGGGPAENRHRLVSYNLTSRGREGSLMRSFVPVPCFLTCGRLVNLKGRLIMVGGIGKPDRSDVIKGIGIWGLLSEDDEDGEGGGGGGKVWEEIARMPPAYFHGFGEFDDVFASSGGDELVYIQSYGAPALLLFDVKQKQWRWSVKCPVSKSTACGLEMP